MLSLDRAYPKPFFFFFQQGIPTVERVVVASDTKGGRTVFQLLAEGTNLQAVMGVQGVDGRLTRVW